MGAGGMGAGGMGAGGMGAGGMGAVGMGAVGHQLVPLADCPGRKWVRPIRLTTTVKHKLAMVVWRRLGRVSSRNPEEFLESGTSNE